MGQIIWKEQAEKSESTEGYNQSDLITPKFQATYNKNTSNIESCYRKRFDLNVPRLVSVIEIIDGGNDDLELRILERGQETAYKKLATLNDVITCNVRTTCSIGAI